MQHYWYTLSYIAVILCFLIVRTQQDIVFGTSSAQTGPSQFLGVEVVKGLEAGFHLINTNGGIRGENLTLIVTDDQFCFSHFFFKTNSCSCC